jgi:hypothetical protein
MMFWIGIGAYITKPDLGRSPISLEGCPKVTLFTNISQTFTNYTYSTTTSLYNATIDLTPVVEDE